MRPMRWTPDVVVTLLVRAAGLVLAVLFLPRAMLEAIGLALYVIPKAGTMGSGSVVSETVRATWAIGVFGAGVYCFVSGRWLIRRLTAGLVGSENRCKSCGYDLAGVERGKRCPECGAVRW